MNKTISITHSFQYRPSLYSGSYGNYKYPVRLMYIKTHYLIFNFAFVFLLKLPRVSSNPWQVLPEQKMQLAQTVECLHLGGQDISKLSNFECFANLRRLHLNCNRINNIEHLAVCFRLEYLNISTNELTSLN